MMRFLLLIIFLVSQLSFSQTEKDNHELYSLILSEQLKFGVENKVDSILLIEQYKDSFEKEYVIFDKKSDSISESDISMIYINTYKDTVFIKRLIKEHEYYKTIKNITSDFKNHPKLKLDLLTTKNIHYQTITAEKYYSYFGKKFKKKNPWKRIEKKYQVRNVVEFSNVNYSGNIAAAYYELHCGDLCGTGSIVVFEKVNGKWKITTEINLWMS